MLKQQSKRFALSHNPVQRKPVDRSQLAVSDVVVAVTVIGETVVGLTATGALAYASCGRTHLTNGAELMPAALWAVS
jgi:hypothetical protein